MFTLILGGLGFIFLVSGACYVRQSYKFNVLSRERKLIKQELLKIKDTEYTQFLLNEKAILDSRLGNKIGGNGINETRDGDYDDEEESEEDE